MELGKIIAIDSNETTLKEFEEGVREASRAPISTSISIL
jgi:hypothetical protein